MAPELDSKPESSTKAFVDASQLEDTSQKSRWERSWPTIACGAGLFSDGYLNGVCLFFFFTLGCR